MEIALIVVGVFIVAILIAWGLTFISDPKEIDEEMESEVRAESPEVRERARFEEAMDDAERNKEEIAFYSPGDAADTVDSGE